MDDTRDLRDDLGLSPAETAIAADLRATFLVAPDPATAERHIAAMVAAREAVRAPSVISLAGHRSRKAIAAAGLVGAVVLGSAGVAAASGGLPDPIQRVVASVGRPIGIDLPTPASEPSTTVAHDGGGGDNEKPSTPSSTEPSGSPSAVPGNGDDNRADPGKGVEATTPSPNANPHATPGTPADHPKPTVTTPKPKSPSDGNGNGNGDGKDNGNGGNGK